MSEAIEKTKHATWKYLGAIVMEPKDGEQAISYTRALGLCAFSACMVMWMSGFIVPDAMVHTLWGLIGIKGARDAVGAAYRD